MAVDPSTAKRPPVAIVAKGVLATAAGENKRK
jgi:hypothetical protein